MQQYKNTEEPVVQRHDTNQDQSPVVSVVVIGRNEGERLVICLNSVLAMNFPRSSFEVIYVDSASTDNSVANADALGVTVIEVKAERPTAAIGRNAGWQQAKGQYILFLDGDTELDASFVSQAIPHFAREEIAGVSGNRREINPEASIYNRMVDLEWLSASGEVDYCAGDALIRRCVLVAVNGFDESLIAGEEPDMWRRMRALGHKALRIDVPMTMHDMAMYRWAQYWGRASRTGHAYAEVSERYKQTEMPLWNAIAVKNRIHAVGLMGLMCLALALSILWSHVGPLIVVLVLYSLLVIRTAKRQTWRSDDVRIRYWYGLHAHVQQIPIFFGQVSYFWSRFRGQKKHLIEYRHG